jgi:lipopolysaccharide/colanic/teichoic acid biosynthesis glycosyltransferase
MERFFDVVFSGLALTLLMPVLVPVMCILKLTGEGEIFFFQSRIGKNGVPFRLFKFATMLKDSPNMGTGTITVKGDPRVLPFGRVLRKTKINELPQLINIFVGDMSIIGPRPLTEQAFSSYPVKTQKIVTKVRPGLSGIGSIIFRGEEEIMQGELANLHFYSKVIAPYKGALEEWFVSERSLKIYFLAIIVTAWVVIRPASRIAWRVFNELPRPPRELQDVLNF